MPTLQLGFFAARADLEEVLRAIEGRHTLRCAKAGLFDSPSVQTWEALSSIPGLGVAACGDAAQEQAFLVADARTPLRVRHVPQRDGGSKFAIDQLANPECITFRPGGTYTGTAVIAGQIGTTSASPESRSLFGLFASEIRRRFGKIASYYVGKEAMALLEAGHRLTANVKSPSLYDLRR